MRKILVGAAFLLPAVPFAIAQAAALPDAPPLPVLVDQGPGGGDPADPTADNDTVVPVGDVGSVSVDSTAASGVNVAVQAGAEGNPTSLGRVGVHAGTDGVAVYGEDYTDGDMIAGALAPVLDLVSDSPDCPAAGAAACDAALVTVTPPAVPIELPAVPIELPAAPIELPAVGGLTDVVDGLGATVGGLLGG